MSVSAEKNKLLRESVEAELKTAWDRKSSFETRAFSLVALNFGFLALYLSLQRKEVLDVRLADGPRCIFVAAAVVSALSVLCAAASAFPANYPALSVDRLQRHLDVTPESTTDSLARELLQSRILQLEDFRQSNRWKGIVVAISFILFAVCAILYAGSLGYAVLT